MQWISIKDRLPPQGIKIKIMTNDIEAEAIFKIHDIDEYTESWGWTLTKEMGEKFGTLRPTYWMPLPDVPKE